MSKEELKQTILKAEEKIHKDIKELYPNSSVGLDGIVSINDYLDINNPDSNPLKILWVLKERGAPNNKLNEDFNLSVFMKYLGQYKNWKKTYGPMCLVTEGILEWQRTKDEKFFEYKNLFDLRVTSVSEGSSVYYNRDNKKDGYRVFPLDHIAFLNIKKLGSTKNTSNQGIINAEYEKPQVKNILKEQFDYIDADIIIMGNHVVKLAEDLAEVPISNYTHVGEYGAHDYYYDSKKNKLFIFADHPSRPGNKEEYCNSIFDVIKKYSKELLKQ